MCSMVSTKALTHKYQSTAGLYEVESCTSSYCCNHDNVVIVLHDRIDGAYPMHTVFSSLNKRQNCYG